MKKERYIMRAATAIAGLLAAIACHAEESNDSVNTYESQTVTTEVTIQGRTVLTAQDVNVTNSGQLTLNGPQGVKINRDFHVARGGILRVNGSLQYAVSFAYDASGNRIRRERKY